MICKKENFFPRGVHYMVPGTYVTWPDHLKHFYNKTSIAEDLQAIKKVGFNSIRLWLSMTNLDFDLIDYIMEQVKERGLKIVITLGTFYVSDEYLKRVPGARFVDQLGHQNYDVYPRCCYNHPQYRKDAQKFIAEIVERYKKDSSLLAWSLHNEIMYPGSGQLYCYNTYTIEEFKKWLERKYLDINKLNRKWKTFYQNFGAVFPPKDLPLQGGNSVAWVDWRKFSIKNLVKFLRWEAEMVRKMDSKHSLTTDITVALNIHTEQVLQEYWEFAKVLDIMGFITFPTLENITYPRMRIALDEIYSASQSIPMPRNIWMTELEVMPDDPDGLREYTWTAIAHGAKGVFYMRWRPIQSGVEARYFGLCDLDGKPTKSLKEAEGVIRAVSGMQELLLNSNPPKAEVAIYYSVSCYIVTHGDGMVGDLVRSTLGIHKALTDEQIPTEFIRPQDIQEERLLEYKILYLPFPYAMSETTVRKIMEYVKNGGVLYSEARWATKNDEGEIYSLIPGARLNKLLNFKQRKVHYNWDPRTHHQIKIVNSITTRLNKGDRLWSGGCEEELDFGNGVAQPTVLGEFFDGIPAIISLEYGKGKIYYVTSLLGCGYESFGDMNTGKFLAAVAEKAGVKRPIQIKNVNEQKQIEARILRNSKSNVLLIINHKNRSLTPMIKVQTTKEKIRMIYGVSTPQIEKNRGGLSIRTKLNSKEVQVYLLE